MQGARKLFVFTRQMQRRYLGISKARVQNTVVHKKGGNLLRVLRVDQLTPYDAQTKLPDFSAIAKARIYCRHRNGSAWKLPNLKEMSLSAANDKGYQKLSLASDNKTLDVLRIASNMRQITCGWQRSEVRILNFFNNSDESRPIHWFSPKKWR